MNIEVATKVIAGVIIAIIPNLIDYIKIRNRDQEISQLVEIYKKFPPELNDLKSDWKYYIDDKIRSKLGIKHQNSVILRMFFGAIGLGIIIFSLPPLVNSDSLITTSVYLLIFIIGTVTYALNLIKYLHRNQTRALSPQRALDALKILKHEAENSPELPINDLLLRAWSNKVNTILMLAFENENWISSEFEKHYNKLIPYCKTPKENPSREELEKLLQEELKESPQKELKENLPEELETLLFEHIFKIELKILQAAIYNLQLDIDSKT